MNFLNMIAFVYEGLNQVIERSWRLDSAIQTFDKQEWKGVNIEDVFTFLEQAKSYIIRIVKSMKLLNPPKNL